MKKTNKLYFLFLFLFLSIILQIIVIIKLNSMEDKLNRYKHKQKSESAEENKGQHAEQQTTDTGSSSSPNQPNKIETFSENDLKKQYKNALFIGDSRIEGIKKFTPISEYTDFCCNVGININNITKDDFYIRNSKIKTIDAIRNYQYQKIIIAIGYNELGWDYEDTFITKYGNLIQDIQTTAPNSNIIVLSILHVNESVKTPSDYETNNRIDLYNNKIEEMCTNNKITFIDLNTAFTDSSGDLIKESTTDGIHLSADYCNKFLNLLTSYFTE